LKALFLKGLACALSAQAFAVAPPTGLVTRTGDRSIVLHWNREPDTELSGYHIYRASNGTGRFASLTPRLLRSPGYCDLDVTNHQTWFYRVTAVAGAKESPPSKIISVTARPFASDDEFLDYLQQTSFDYFWYEANPVNGLIPDRSSLNSSCSIAAVGFGLTAIGIGVDHGWITRAQGAQRTAATLGTFLHRPQGDGVAGVIGYRGWFYHFLDMKTGTRFMPFKSELSSIDTALFLAGVLYARQYFNSTNAEESAIRSMAEALYNRVDWRWMARDGESLTMGWVPEKDFLSSKWIGYNEAMLLYCLALGAATNPLPASAWNRWTSGYRWSTNYQQAYVNFAPLFGHQYSHCWIDFRNIADAYMRRRKIDYFENSRRATLAQRAYCMAKPSFRSGEPGMLWGLTASDGPHGYAAHGAPPAENDDDTIAPTAVCGSLPFAPEYCLPTLRYFYERLRNNIWTQYGFRDAFNLRADWWSPDELGIDEGPIVVMIENFRSGSVWRLFMQNDIVQRGLQRADFRAVKTSSSH
jgi:hypothetical protein